MEGRTSRRWNWGWLIAAGASFLVAGLLASNVARHFKDVDAFDCSVDYEPLSVGDEDRGSTLVTLGCDALYEIQLAIMPTPDRAQLEEIHRQLTDGSRFELTWSISADGVMISRGTTTAPSGRRHSTSGAVIVLDEFDGRVGTSYTLAIELEGPRPFEDDFELAVRVALGPDLLPPKVRALSRSALPLILCIGLVIFAAYATSRLVASEL